MNCTAIFKTNPTDRGMCCTFNALAAEEIYRQDDDQIKDKEDNIDNIDDGDNFGFVSGSQNFQPLLRIFKSKTSLTHLKGLFMVILMTMIMIIMITMIMIMIITS